MLFSSWILECKNKLYLAKSKTVIDINFIFCSKMENVHLFPCGI